MALSEYQIALNNFNAAMNADPVQRALNDEHRAWGDIMYDEDMRNNATRPRETMDQFTARITVPPTPPTGGEPQTFRRWNAEQPQRQSRFDQRPPRHDQRSMHLPAVRCLKIDKSQKPKAHTSTYTQ
jgi:hypothetical protein